jgi:hypothetical protein
MAWTVTRNDLGEAVVIHRHVRGRPPTHHLAEVRRDDAGQQVAACPCGETLVIERPPSFAGSPSEQ